MRSDEIQTVCAYCRVSTDRDDQASSFESQKRFFREYIEREPAWRLYQIYADEGITGTSVKKRKAFQQMMADAYAGKFSLILTKEISRFARNLLDSIYYTRELRRIGVGVFFLNDNIDTRDSDAELRLAILSSIAQEESRRTSERVKWGQKRRMEDGVVFGHSLLGYDVREGKIIVNEEGAGTVRFIFSSFLEKNMSVSDIARALSARGILPKKSKAWSPSVVLRILKNEKYCGDLIQKKTVTPDYLSHEKKYNHGEEEFVILRDHHEAIIPREQFDAVQKILCTRRNEKRGERFTERYPFSGKIRCGICGKRMAARVQARSGGIYHLWRCGGSHASSIKNELVLEMMRLVMKEYADVFEEARVSVLHCLRAVDRREEYIEAKQKLLSLYLSGEIEKDEYLSAKARFCVEAEVLGDAQLDGILYEELFFREMLREITVYDVYAEVRLKGTERVFFFELLREGRQRTARLRK